jgi:hypothetical protein
MEKENSFVLDKIRFRIIPRLLFSLNMYAVAFNMHMSSDHHNLCNTTQFGK